MDSVARIPCSDVPVRANILQYRIHSITGAFTYVVKRTFSENWCISCSFLSTVGNLAIVVYSPGRIEALPITAPTTSQARLMVTRNADCAPNAGGGEPEQGWVDIGSGDGVLGVRHASVTTGVQLANVGGSTGLWLSGSEVFE